MKQTTFKGMMLMLLILLPLQMGAAKHFDRIRLGMTQQEVQALVGRPDLTRLDHSMEQWEYHWQKVPLLGDVLTTIVYFTDGRVTAHNTFIPHTQQLPQQPAPVLPMPLQPDYPPTRYDPMYMDEVMSDPDFDTFYRYVRGESFDDDRIKLLTVGCLSNYFTCSQCLRMMNIYNFDSDRMKVLRIMAPHIVDPHNATILISRFTFDSDRRAAARLLGVPWGE